jgi:epoxyqueuosine reductase
VAAGLDAVGIAPVTRFTETRRHLEERREAGLDGGMAFTYRNPARSTDPARILAGAQAIVVGARRYPSQRRPEGPGDPGHPMGVVARYASADHYEPLRRALAAVAARLHQHRWRAVVVADDNALVDREAARRAGLGWYGKNTNLLLPGQGSWFVLGSVVTDAPLLPTLEIRADGCGACRRCLPACPTGALVAPGVLDARRCLAWLLQAPGVFPVEFRVALGGRLYGCDDCQEACPENLADARSHPEDPQGRAPGPSDVPAIDLLEVLAATDEELLARLGRWYIPQRKARYLRRNAPPPLPSSGTLRRALGDPDPIVRGHAVWAAARLGRRDLLAGLGADPDPDVRRELALVAADLT